MNTCPSHPYVLPPQTVARKVRSTNCIRIFVCCTMKISLQWKDEAQACSSMTMLLHKVSSLTAWFAKVDVE